MNKNKNKINVKGLQKTLDRFAKLLNERLYGFYCAGVARGLQQTPNNYEVHLQSEMEPREAWAFAYGMRCAMTGNLMLTIDVFKHDMRMHFKQ